MKAVRKTKGVIKKSSDKKHNFFVKLFDYLKIRNLGIKPLVFMQLKDKIDFTFIKNKKKMLFKIIYKILIFIILTALIYILFMLIVKFGIFSFLQSLNFRAFLVLMTIILILSFLSCLLKMTNVLYFSKDNSVLITMPVSTNTIFTSKMIVTFIYELTKNTFYILPFFVVYGLIMSLTFWFFLWSIFSVFFFTMLSVVLSGLFSIPTMFILVAFKKQRVLEYIFVCIIASIFVWGLIKTINLIPSDIDLIRDWGKIFWKLQDFLNSFASIFIIFDLLLQFLTGMAYGVFGFQAFSATSFLTFGVCGAIIIFSLLVIHFASKPLFLKMISTPFEYKSDITKKQHKNGSHRARFSVFKNQIILSFRTSNVLYNLLSVCLLAPIAILFQNRVIAAMDTKSLGNIMGLSFNILIILLMILSMNSMCASLYSREADAVYINKTSPQKFATMLGCKLLVNVLFSAFSIIASVIVMNSTASIGLRQSVLLAFALIFVTISHIFWSAEMDIMNPLNKQYQTVGSHPKNPNENKSTVLAFFVSVIFSFISYFLMKESLATVYLKLFFVGLILCATRLYLFFTKTKLYYKEK